jgi:predicted nucleotidyltransferase
MSFNGRVSVGKLLDGRRLETAKQIENLRTILREAGKRCGRNACVYVTGSYGRGEASPHSDLDLFVLGKGTHEKPSLSRLDEILVKADLINATKKLQLPKFSGDGQYLVGHTVTELVETLGEPEDDVENTFTARLLLLLESFPLIGKSAYDQITSEVIGAYWRDFEGHENNFRPAFLANDILRMWRTFCVNYEARTRKVPEKEAAKRRLKNYKLKHSRLLTCYSALLYLLAVFSRNKTVSPADAQEMISLSPTARLEWLVAQPELRSARVSLRKLIAQYEEFLSKTDAAEADLLLRFMDKRQREEYRASASHFGDLVYKVMNEIGKKTPEFHRLLVV